MKNIIKLRILIISNKDISTQKRIEQNEIYLLHYLLKLNFILYIKTLIKTKNFILCIYRIVSIYENSNNYRVYLKMIKKTDIAYYFHLGCGRNGFAFGNSTRNGK